MLDRWMGRIRSLFARPGAGSAPLPPPSFAATTAQRPRSPDPFEEALRRLAALPDGGAGRVRLVSLAEFRESVGDKWPRLADKVAILADNVIRSHLGGGALFRREGEDCWLLLFPAAEPAQARDRTARIADELSRRLLGERCVHDTRPLAQAAHIPAGQALDRRGGVDRAALARALDPSRAILDDAAPLPEGMAETVRPPRPDPTADWRPMRFAHGRDDPLLMVPPLPPDARLSVLWRPTWVAESEAIAAYSTRVVRIDRNGDVPLEGPLAYPTEDASAALRLDLFAAAAAVRALRQPHAERPPAIIVPLSWQTLVSPERKRLAVPFAELTRAERSARVKFELFHLPDDVSGDALADTAGFLASLGGEVMVRLRLSSTLPGRAGGLGIRGMGLDLSELRVNERMDDESLLAVLDGLHGTARDAGVDCYLWSARRRRVVGEVVTGGFGMVNGPGLMKDVGRPAVVLPAPRRRFAAAA